MKLEQDAFGQEIYDYHHGVDVIEIIERTDGYINTSIGPAAYFAPFSDWSRPEQEAIQLANGRTLDIGCGAGRVCLHLQELGHEVVGIDNSPMAVKTAGLRGVRDVRLLSIMQISRKALGVFDTIVMFGNNFGLFGNVQRARWLLRRLRGMSSPGARILAQSRDISQTEDPAHLALHERNRRKGRMPGQVRIRVRYKDISGPWFDYLLVSPEEMAQIIEGTGWRIERIFAEESSPSYVAVLARE